MGIKTINDIATFNENLNKCRDSIVAKLREKHIDEKIEILSNEIKNFERGYSQRIQNKDFEKNDVRIIEAIIQDLNWYKEELLAERNNNSLDRPILSALNPEYGKDLPKNHSTQIL